MKDTAAPLVSVICLSYNHARFIEEALDSVLNQTYPHVELILVDDASTDGSPDVIRRWAARYSSQVAHVLLLPTNVGNCAAFNRGLALSQGSLLIDFATDDVLLPTRIEEQVAAFAALDESWGVVYTDCELVTEEGVLVRRHYARDPNGRTVPAAPSGDVFAHVLGHYFISTPTMMMRRRVFEELNGYDEALAYEDFDFWVRSARTYQYYFLDRVLTRKRLHPRSLSRQAYQPGDRQLASTIAICQKARALCRTTEEFAALARRVRFELRQAVRHKQWAEARLLFALLRSLPGRKWW